MCSTPHEPLIIINELSNKNGIGSLEMFSKYIKANQKQFMIELKC